MCFSKGECKFSRRKKATASLDTLLLSAFALPQVGDTVIDLGTGSGVMAIIIAALKTKTQVTGVEIQRELVEMARRSVQLNRLTDRVKVIEGDVRKYKEFLPPRSFDACLMNPPYRKLKSGRVNPLGEKAVARHEIHGTLKDFLACAFFVLKPKGRVFVIYPARRMVELLYQMRTYKIEPKRLRLVYSKSGGRAEFALTEGLLGGGEELYVEPPLTIYDQDNRYTEEINNFLSALTFLP